MSKSFLFVNTNICKCEVKPVHSDERPVTRPHQQPARGYSSVESPELDDPAGVLVAHGELLLFCFLCFDVVVPFGARRARLVGGC